MKIEILDREIWIDKCNRIIDFIKKGREERENLYIEAWRNSKWKIGSREGKLPPPSRLEYPSYYGYYSLASATTLLSLLLTEGTGTIYVDYEDIEYLEVL